MNKQEILKRDNYTCQKCGYKNDKGIGLEIHHINPKRNKPEDEHENLIALCSICHNYAPDEPKYFKKYLNEKINGDILNTFRNTKWSIGERTRFGMTEKAKEGGIVGKPALGYKILGGKLIIDPEQAEKVRTIFNDFLESGKSLNKIADTHNLTVGGLLKILANRTYIGEIKFKESYKGHHESLISKELFDKVQAKIETNRKAREQKRQENTPS